MKTYPVMLNLSGRLVAVIGAGNVGMRKVCSLCDAGANVRLIAGKNFSPVHYLPSCVELIEEEFNLENSAAMLEGCCLVFACCNDQKTNSEVTAAARKLGIWANAADQPADCDFFCPAVIRNGEVTIAIGTGGNAPSLSAELKNFIVRNLPGNMGAFAESVGRIRNELKASCNDAAKRQAAMKKISSEEGHSVFSEKGEAGLRELLAEINGGN